MYIFLIISIIILCIIFYNLSSNVISKDNPPVEYIIPRKIFQLVPDKNSIHPYLKQNINNIKTLNPNWKYTLYDDEDIVNYISRYYPQYLNVYLKINPKYGAARADFFRYLLMYKEGGVYLDIKSSMSRPLDRIIYETDEYLLLHWEGKPLAKELNNIYGEYQQWNIICKPKHPFLENVINNVVKNIENYDYIRDGYGKPSVLRITGPYVYSKSIFPLLQQNKYTLYTDNTKVGLVYNATPTDHTKIIGTVHYSELKEPIIL
jgi:hypothetical protein